MQLNDEPQSYYDVLELTTDATPQEIRSAYLRLKASYSKDNIANYSIYSREETEQMLQKIEEAYLILANPERRRAYDVSHQGQFESTSGFMHQEAVPAPVMPSISNDPAPQSFTSPNTGFSSILFNSSESDDMILSEQEWSGGAIRRIRESKRITLEDLADHTRISKAYLMALEEENYQKLPAIVYVRGFLQQVSRRLKLPTELVVKNYIERIKVARPDKM
jgi:DnaJ-class molecular chaperone